MSISRLHSMTLAIASLMLCVSTTLGVEWGGVDHYPHKHPPRPHQQSGPPHAGQEPPSGIEASGPVFVEVEDPEIFKQPDLSTYGAGIPANTGWWFSYDYLRWTVSVPNRVPIGNPNTVYNYFTATHTYAGTTVLGGGTSELQRNTVDTGFLNNGPSNGYRWEGGFMDGEHGFLLSAFRLYDNDQRLVANNVGTAWEAPPAGNFNVSPLQGFVRDTTPGNTIIHDADLNNNGIFGRYGANPASLALAPGNPPFAPGPPDIGDLATLPVYFNTLVATNHREIWGAEAMYVCRFRPTYHGSVLEFIIGPRYFKFDERFLVVGTGGTLADSHWNTRGDNNLVGGQIGLRWAHRHGRLTLSSEGRFLAAANIQKLSQEGLIASQNIPGAIPTVDGRPWTLQPTGFSTAIRKTEWAPLGELRFELAYQIFNKASFSLGWTGIIMDGIARPSNIIDYKLPNMGMQVHGKNRQSTFLQGLTLGVEFNR